MIELPSDHPFYMYLESAFPNKGFSVERHPENFYWDVVFKDHPDKPFSVLHPLTRDEFIEAEEYVDGFDWTYEDAISQKLFKALSRGIVAIIKEGLADGDVY